MMQIISAGADMDGWGLLDRTETQVKNRVKDKKIDTAFAAMISGMEQPLRQIQSWSEHTDAGAEGSAHRGPNKRGRLAWTRVWMLTWISPRPDTEYTPPIAFTSRLRPSPRPSRCWRSSTYASGSSPH